MNRGFQTLRKGFGLHYSFVLLSFSLVFNACNKNRPQAQPTPRPPEQKEEKHYNNSWKNISDSKIVSFETDPVEFHKPPDFDHLPADQQAHILDTCKTSYKTAVTELDESIADAAIVNEKARALIKKFNKRILELLEAEAKMEIADEGSTSSSRKKGSSPSSLTVEERVNDRLAATIGNCNKTEAGCTGASPSRIREVFRRGNFRERMFLIFGFARKTYVAKFMDKPAVVQKLNSYLAEKGWELHTDATDPQNPFIPGIYQTLGRARLLWDAQYRDEYPAKRGARLSDDHEKRIPFSKRERSYFSEEGLDDHSFDPTLPGEAWVRLPKESTNDYFIHTESAMLPQSTGVSGTTDLLLTFAHYLGFTDPAETKLLLIALMGWMIDSRDHTSHEILTAANSFYIHYRYSPNFYKEFFSENPEFVHTIDSMEHRRHQKKPREVLEHCVTDALNHLHHK